MLGDLKISEIGKHNTSGMAARSTGDPAGVLEEVWRDSSVAPCMNLKKNLQGAFLYGEVQTLRHKIRIPCLINRNRMAQL